jgi:hypothetical protein
LGPLSQRSRTRFRRIVVGVLFDYCECIESRNGPVLGSSDLWPNRLQAFRFNERKNEDGDQGRFLQMLDSFFEKLLTYKHLIGEDAALATT